MRDVNKLCRRSALALALGALLAPVVPAWAQTTVSVPLKIVKITQRTNPNKFAYRLLITIGVDGAPPRNYLLDTGSAQFNIDVGLKAQQGKWPAWLPLGKNASLPKAQVKLYGFGYFGYLQSRTTISNIQFYDPTSGAVMLNRKTPGAPIGVNYAWVDSAIDPRISHPPTGRVVATINGVKIHIWKPFQQAMANGTAPEEGVAWGIFGAGNFNHSYPDMLTKTGYIVEANGTSTSPGNCAKACLIMGLTPELRAQFLTTMPWRTGVVDTAPISGANEAGEYAWQFNVKLSKNGTTWKRDQLPTLIDTGSMTPVFLGINDVDKFPFTNPANQSVTTPLKSGIQITLTGSTSGAGSYAYTTGDPLGADRTQTGGYNVNPNVLTNAIIGLPFLFKNALMYDLQNGVNGYTPFYIVAVPLKAGLDVTPDMGMLGLAGVISGSGTLTIADQGVANLSAANTYTGATTVANGGWLALAGPGSIAASSNVTVNGVFDVSRASQASQIQSLSGNGKVELGGNGLVLVDAAGTFAGVIADGGLGNGKGGSLTVASGTETLTGANTYTGATTIAGPATLALAGSDSIADSSVVKLAGVLDIAGASSTTVIQTLAGDGSVRLGANTLQLDAAGDTFAFSGALSDHGAGGRVVLAGGQEVFTGLLAASGQNEIAKPATLVNDGKIQGPLLDQGTLAGNGQVVGQLDVAGTIAPGQPGKASYQTLSVTGHYVQHAGSTYQARVDLAHPGTSSRIAVTGSADILQGATLNVTTAPASVFHVGSQYTLLSASHGVSGSYTLAGDVALSPVLDLAIGHDANHVYLNVAQTRPLTEIATTPNQTSVLGAVQALGTANALFAATSSLPTKAAIRAAAGQLGGDIYASTQNALLVNSQFITDAMDAQLTDRDAHDTRWWVQLVGSQGKRDSDGNAAEAKRKLRGILVGNVMAVGNGGRIGAFIGHTHTSVKVDAHGASATGKAFRLGVYGGDRFHSGFGLRGGVAYARSKLSTRRTVAMPTLQSAEHPGSDYDAHVLQGFGEVGYRIDFRRASLEPFARAAYVKLSSDDFSESGGTTALHGSDESAGTLFTTIGARGAITWQTTSARHISLHGMLGWRHASGDVDLHSTLAFGTGGSFTIASAPIPDSSVALGVGLKIQATRSFWLDFAYRGDMGSGMHENSVHLDMGWAF